MVIGSNNWVVSGAHTVSGKPLLSNDMHLGHQMPNLWYEAHLRCGNFDAAGVTLPGLPYVIVGHNQRIAWGFTNIGPTVEDVYVETFNPDGQYLTPEGWKAPEHRSEVIHVKGKPDVMVDVAVTRHGPVITELIPGETRKLALRWTLYDGTHDPFFEVDSAQNWEQFRNAFSAFDAPGQNVVYADVEGNIGYQATGKIPIRASGDGSLPENGSDNAHEWTGYIPFDKLPRAYNPPSGIIATANSRITPDGYPYSISTGWEAPWRSARIYRVLESGKKFSSADMLALQTDIYSEADRYFAERFVYSVDHVQECFCADQAGRRTPAGMGWPHDRGFSRAHHRVSGTRRTGTPAARAQAGRRARGSQTSRGHAELEDLFLGNAVGVAGKCGPPSACALASASLCQLRRSACRGG